eukprot:gene8489-10084_t
MSSAGGGLLTFVPVPVAVATWLRKHGKAVRPELTNQQRVELKECFNLIDSDGSGAIGAGELMDAFRFMGIKITRPELKSILDEVDRDGSGEVEYAEFVEIMTCSLERFSSRSNDDEEVAAPLPFPLLATAYRRRKLLEAMFSGDSEKRNRMTDQANRAMAEVEQLKQQSEERLARKKRVTKSAGSRPAGSVVLNSFGDAVDHQGETWRRDREPFGKGYTCPPIKKNGPGQMLKDPRDCRLEELDAELREPVEPEGEGSAWLKLALRVDTGEVGAPGGPRALSIELLRPDGACCAWME